MMHDSIMSHMGMEQESQHNHTDNTYGGNEGWVDMTGYSPHHQSPIHEFQSYGFVQQSNAHGVPVEPSFNRMAAAPQQQQQQPQQPQHQQHQPPTTHQQLLPLIMPSNTTTWPSMLTNPSNYQAPPVAIPPIATPLKTAKLPAIHTQPTPRKTLTDADRKRICQFHEDNPTVKQTEIGAMFGVERSTISKVLRQKEKYLFPEDRSLSPVKRTKGKFPDIERALSNWVRNSQKQGIPLTDAAIKEKARFFATTVGSGESHVKANSTSWLEKFKQKNNIGSGKTLSRRASETNISDAGSYNDSTAGSASQTPSGISPVSPTGLASPSPLSDSKTEETMKAEGFDGYVDFGSGHGYKHANSQSTTSLSSTNYTDTAASSFSAGPTSPTTSFNFSPDTSCSPFLPSQQQRNPPASNNFQRPRSQTFPMLGIDPSYISNTQAEPSTPKYMPVTAPSSALESSEQEMGAPYSMDTTISSPHLHHSSSNGSMGPPLSTTPLSTTLSPQPPGSSPSSPTQDDARRALDTLLAFLSQNQNPGLCDPNELMTVVKLTEKLRLQQHNGAQLPRGLHRIPEQDGEALANTKLEHPMTTECS